MIKKCHICGYNKKMTLSESKKDYLNLFGTFCENCGAFLESDFELPLVKNNKMKKKQLKKKCLKQAFLKREK